MLNYLRIFSWFLLTFGVVGFLAVLIGLVPEIGSRNGALGLMAVQAAVGGSIVKGFQLLKRGEIEEKKLLYVGWTMVIALIVLGQVWVNLAEINL